MQENRDAAVRLSETVTRGRSAGPDRIGRYPRDATLRAIPFAVALALAGCGGGGDDDPVTPAEDDPQTDVTPAPDTPMDIDAGQPEAPVGSTDVDDGGGPIEVVVSDPDGDDMSGLVVEGLDGQAGSDAVSPWLVTAEFFRANSRTPGSGDASVGLTRYDDDFAVANHVDFFSKELDACTMNRDDSGGDGDGSAPGNGPPPFISGGSSITINTPSGPWFELDAAAVEEGGTEVDYATDNGLPGPLPADATLSIPGDAFPNVAAFALPGEAAVPIRLLPDESERLGLDTVYSWMPENGSDYIGLQFIAFDSATGDFIDFPISCLAVDDGRFDPSDEVLAFLATTTDDVTVRYERTRDVLTLADGIVFWARTIVAE